VVGTIAVAVFSGVVSLPLVLLAVVLEVLCGAAFGPAEFALVRRSVAPEDRSLAVARMQSRSQLAGLLGPLIGGALYGISPAVPFLADAASYLVSFVLVAFVRAGSSPTAGGRVSLTAGWRWLRQQSFLFPAGLWLAGLTAVFAGVGLAILVLARERGVSPAGIGLMFAISTAGGLLGALVTPALQRRMRPVAVLRAAAIIDTVATLALVPLDSPVAIGVAGAAAFFLAPAASASLFGELSGRCPDELVGRAQSSLGLLVGAVAPVMPLLIGGIIDRTGPLGGVLSCAAAFAVLALAAFTLPAFRRAALTPRW